MIMRMPLVGFTVGGIGSGNGRGNTADLTYRMTRTKNSPPGIGRFTATAIAPSGGVQAVTALPGTGTIHSQTKLCEQS